MNPPPPLRAAAALTLGLLSVLVNACQSQPAPVLDYACYSPCGPGDGFPRAAYPAVDLLSSEKALNWIVCASSDCPSDYGCVTTVPAAVSDSGFCGVCRLLCHSDADCPDAGTRTLYGQTELLVFCQQPAPGAAAGEGYCMTNPPFPDPIPVVSTTVSYGNICNGAQIN